MNALLSDPCCLVVVLGGGAWLLATGVQRVAGLLRAKRMRAVERDAHQGVR